MIKRTTYEHHQFVLHEAILPQCTGTIPREPAKLDDGENYRTDKVLAPR